MRRHPDISALGETGSYYFLNRPTWIARHVETIEIESEQSGRRRLTVDVELPADPAAIVEEHDGRALFGVPIALLAKHPPTAQIDVRDEAGNALPLLTRAENGWISSLALMTAMEENGAAPYPEFQRELDDLVFTDPVDITPALAAAMMMEEVNDAGPGAERIKQVIQDLAVCSMLWVNLWGKPGERRVIKLSYAISLERQPLVLHNEHEAEVRVSYPDERGEVTFPAFVPGSIRWRDTIARLISPVGTALGWANYDVLVGFPDMRGAHTYHMQVVAPEGLSLTGIDTESGEDGTTGRHCDGLRAHLYLPEVDGSATGPIRFALKPERRGFLNLSLMATVVTACGLWLAQATVEEAQRRSVNQISAAVLLVLPALLAVFVVRQTEHPIVTRLLAGVRALVLLAGLASVLAAAALSGIRPGTWQDVGEAWTWCAAVATIAALGVLIAWVRSFDRMNPFRPRDRAHGPGAYVARVALTGLLVVSLCLGVRRNTLGLGEAEPLAIALLLLAALVAGIVTVSPTHFRARLLRIACVVYVVAAVAAATATAATHADLRNDVVVGAATVALVALLAGLISMLRPTAETG